MPHHSDDAAVPVRTSKKGRLRASARRRACGHARKDQLDRTPGRRTRSAWGRPSSLIVLIIGGGQAGIMLGARLRQLGVPTIIAEKNARAGDFLAQPLSLARSARSGLVRPSSLYAVSRTTGRSSRRRTKWVTGSSPMCPRMELNYWGSTEVKSARFDAVRKRWAVDVIRQGRSVTLEPAQFVFATGAYGPPNTIALPGAEVFRGEILHSSAYSDGERIQGKALRRYRRRELRPRCRGRSLGGRRRGDDRAAIADHRRSLRNADGTRIRALFRAGGREGHRRRHGRHVEHGDSVRAPTSPSACALRQDQGARRRPFTTICARPAFSRLRPGRNRPDDEGLSNRIWLLHRRRAAHSSSSTATSRSKAASISRR